MKQTKAKLFLRCLIFIIGLILVYSLAQSIFRLDDSRIKQTVKGFYTEEEETLDAVYVGASNVYAFWQAPLAWEEYGITAYSMSIPSMPVQAIKYMIEECRKTQPDALYIINLNSFKDTDVDVSKLHRLTDYMPFSNTKVEMIDILCNAANIKMVDRMEYYFPIIRFHSKWNELTPEDFDFSLEGLKAGVHHKNFLKKSISVLENYRTTDQKSDVSQEQKMILDDLLSFCEQESVKALFVVVPQAISNESLLGEMNMLCDMVEKQGYTVMNLQGSVDEIGLDMTTDYYDNKHTNIHGSLKYTHYLGKYLSENYGFEDKRSNPDYESWNVAYDKYLDIIAPYAPDFELNHEKRDYSIQAPKLLDCTVVNQDLKVEWEKSEGANGYLIYCRTSAGDSSTYTAWECIGEAEEEATSYTVNNPDADLTYNYTVVPIRTENENTYYGKYNMDGINGKVVTE